MFTWKWWRSTLSLLYWLVWVGTLLPVLTSLTCCVPFSWLSVLTLPTHHREIFSDIICSILLFSDVSSFFPIHWSLFLFFLYFDRSYYFFSFFCFSSSTVCVPAGILFMQTFRTEPISLEFLKPEIKSPIPTLFACYPPPPSLFPCVLHGVLSTPSTSSVVDCSLFLPFAFSFPFAFSLSLLLLFLLSLLPVAVAVQGEFAKDAQVVASGLLHPRCGQHCVDVWPQAEVKGEQSHDQI